MVPTKKPTQLKSICFLVAILLITGFIQPDNNKKPVVFGMYIGSSISSQWSTAEASPEYTRTTGNESGVSIGLFADFSLGRLFAIQGELFLVDKGGNHTITVAGFPFGDIDITYSMTYVEIPILLKLIPIQTKNFSLFSHIGAFFAFITNSTYEFKNEVIPDFTQDLGDLKQTDYGLIGGGGISFALKGFNLHIEYRYSMGFHDLTFPTGPDFPEIELRNFGHKILLGISFVR
jgi:hypothetical protein